MKCLLALVIVAGLCPQSYGQTQPSGEQPSSLYATGAPRPVWVSVETVYQRFGNEGEHIAEVSVPLSLHLPIGNALSMSLRSNYATISGSNLATTSGIGDVQIITSYFQEVGTASVVASLGLNATTGMSGLSTEEFRTATLAAQTVYDLRVPTFGQGLRVAPSLTLAFPAGERAALGIGLSYQYRGPYEPIRDLGDQYDPGEEILLTGGADVQLGDATSASLDFTFGLNGIDSWGALAYDPGNSVAVTAQVQQALGVHELRAVGRYRSRGEGELPDIAIGAETVVPTQLWLLLDGRYEASPAWHVGALARVRSYGESALFSESQTLFDVGLVPEWSGSGRVGFIARFIYTLGSFSGVTAGGGLRVSF